LPKSALKKSQSLTAKAPRNRKGHQENPRPPQVFLSELCENFASFAVKSFTGICYAALVKLTVAWIGKTKNPAIQSLTDEYLKRLRQYAEADGVSLKDEAALLKFCGRDKSSARRRLVLLDSRGKRAIFAGDALHNPVQVPLWKWNSCFCEDRDLARQSRHTLLADCVEQGALLMPAHFAPPHAAYVKDKGDRFELDWDWDNARGR
jgi:hypothetical protein